MREMFNLKFFDTDICEVTVSKDNMIKETFLARANDALQSIVKNTQASFLTPILPPNAVFYRETSDKVYLCINIPEHIRTSVFSFYHYDIENDGFDDADIAGEYSFYSNYEIIIDEDDGEEYKRIDRLVFVVPIFVPRTLAYISYIKNGDDLSFNNLYLFCYKDQFLTGDTQLYTYPYANLYDDSRVCVGSFRFPSLKKNNLFPVYQHIINFLDTVSNDDLTFRNDSEMDGKELLFIPMKKIIDHNLISKDIRQNMLERYDNAYKSAAATDEALIVEVNNIRTSLLSDEEIYNMIKSNRQAYNGLSEYIYDSLYTSNYDLDDLFRL